MEFVSIHQHPKRKEVALPLFAAENGSTPVPDQIRRELGIPAAYLFGLVHRHGQSSQEGVPLDDLAESLGWNRKATLARLEQLVRAGWLIQSAAAFHDAGRWVADAEAEVPAARPTDGAVIAVPPEEQRWWPLEQKISEALGGIPTRQKRKGNRVLAWVGQLLAVIGRAADSDVGQACQLWERYVGSKEWTYRPRNPMYLAGHFGAWAQENAYSGGSRYAHLIES